MSRNSLIRIVLGVCLFAVLLGTALATPSAEGGTSIFVVDSLGDASDANTADNTCDDGTGACTLRAAIEQANAAAGVNAIEFVVLGTVTLASRLPTITQDLTIAGQGPESTVVQGGDDEGMLWVAPSVAVTIRDLSMRNGASAGYAGAINNQGSLTIERAAFIGNTSTAGGGALSNQGTATISDSTFSGNHGELNGGAIANLTSGTLNLTNTTISGNTANLNGGGVFNNQATLNLTNVTITNNTSDADNNGAAFGGGGITFAAGVSVTVKNTIIAGNRDNSGLAPDCVANVGWTYNSLGHNLIGDGTGCPGFTATGDQVGTGTAPINPGLGPLQTYQGPTQTHALLPGSLAIDAGDNVGCPLTDQRGAIRPEDGDNNQTALCDIGAYKLTNDFDGDSCPDMRENGINAAFGGGRNPKYFWDFFDTPTNTGQRDAIIATGDILRIVQRFGTTQVPPLSKSAALAQALTTPPPSGYHAAFDRSPPSPGADPWDLNGPDGSIAVNDVLLVVRQFGHTCA